MASSDDEPENPMPVPSNDSPDSGSESDSDLDDDEDDQATALLLQRLQAQVNESNSYEAHVNYIDALRKAAELEKLRLARESMNAVFPLTPNMWLEWCEDESRLATSRGAVPAVEALYERGVKEYLSIPLWLQYLEFVEERDTSVADCTEPGIAKMRALFERALTSTGLHFTEGGKVWEAYRDYESALLLSMAEASPEAKSKQVEILRSLFHRQLRVPLVDHAQTLEQYKDWEQQQGVQIGADNDDLSGLPGGVASAYKTAEQMSKARGLFENNITAEKPVDGDLLQHYLEYISVEEATGDPARAQILYERALSVFPVTHEVWLKYTHYLDVNLKVASVLRSVYARAVRNCPWVGALWTKYMLALERAAAPETELSVVFETALGCGFQSPNEYEEFGNRWRPVVLVFIQPYQRGTEFLSTYFPDHVNHNIRLWTYWAHLEATLLKDITAARGVWENLIKTHGWMLEVWQNYISMELLLGNVKEARTLYKRCYSRRLEGTGTQVMCAAWLRFEEEHGALEDYDRAVLKVGPRVAEVQNLQTQQEQKQSTGTERVKMESRPQPSDKVKPKSDVKSRSSKITDNASKTSGRKRGLGNAESENAVKRQKVPKVTAQDTDQPGASETAAGIVTGMEEAERTEQKSENASRELPKQVKELNKAVVFTDECTAFLSNVAFEVTEEDLKEFFSPSSRVKEVRILRERGTARPRGLAYVDFEDEESLTAAIAKNKEELKGRQLSIARSDPKGGRGGGRGSGSSRRGRTSALGRGGGRGGIGGSDSSNALGGGRGLAGPPTVGHRRGGHLKLTGSNTFAVPRNVPRPLGWGNPLATSSSNASGGEVPKSNTEFREMFLKQS
nr:squamous cell carcinoma antigen recognized by T-cells 3-like isoform X2 [Physcomitrium patens]|eukprot:XP_024368844.1 squamous cell carcinoma antigen recognized by T-cells 3-like isoform X2 [Physcomitrella patens]